MTGAAERWGAGNIPLKRPKLERLQVEWLNRGEPDFPLSGETRSMVKLEDTLLARKARVSYQDNWMALAARKLERSINNLEYVAALLYLVDERVIPVTELQPSVGLQYGHLFRAFERAGVDFEARTRYIGSRLEGSRRKRVLQDADGNEVEEMEELQNGYWSYHPTLYFDPLTHTMIRGGEVLPIPPGVDPYDLGVIEDDMCVPPPALGRVRGKRLGEFL